MTNATTPLDQNLAEEMRQRAQQVRDRMNSGSFTPTWSLTGKNAIVAEGQDVVVRLGPRWDYANSMILEGGQRVPNPDYKKGHAFIIGFEHWWDGENGAKCREWCPRIFDAKAPCPVCGASSVLLASGVKDDRAYGGRVAAKEVFIYNAVIGDPRRLDSAGLADFRPLSVPGSIFNAISDIMTGGERPQFARGDITNPRVGFDLVLRRPVKNSGDRWTAQPATEATPLYGQAQAAAFKGWVTRLVNLEDMIRKEMKTPDGLFQAFYNRAPRPGEIPGVQDRVAASAATAAATVPSPTVPDDEFMSGAPASTAASGPAASPAPTVPPVSPDDDFMPPPAGRPRR